MSIESLRRTKTEDPLSLARKIQLRQFGAPIGDMRSEDGSRADISPYLPEGHAESALASDTEPSFSFFNSGEHLLAAGRHIDLLAAGTEVAPDPYDKPYEAKHL